MYVHFYLLHNFDVISERKKRDIHLLIKKRVQNGYWYSRLLPKLWSQKQNFKEHFESNVI